MPELIEELRRLADAWLSHAAGLNTDDQFSRHAGYASGLTVCAAQLSRELDRMMDDA